MSGYRGVIEAGKGFLLGGVKKHVSSVFSTKHDAMLFAETSKEINEKAGNDVARIYTIKSGKRAELVRRKGVVTVSRAKRNPVDSRASDIHLVHDSITPDGFLLERNGFDPFKVEYEATYGYEGFGRNKKKKRYPKGAMKVWVVPAKTYFLANSLEQAKEKLALYLSKL